MTEEDLWQAWQAGDEAAFAAVYEAVSPSLHALSRALVRGTALSADDLFQEVFRRAMAGRFRPTGTLRSWLAAIARNALVDMLQKERRPAPPASPREDPGWVSVEVRDLMDALDEEHREALALRFLQGLSVLEIAGILGVSQATVKRRLREGLDVLAGKSGKD